MESELPMMGRDLSVGVMHNSVSSTYVRVHFPMRGLESREAHSL